MARKKRQKSIKIPGLYYDGERFVPAETYPNYTIFTDRVLAEVLQVSPMTISAWRDKNVIPFRMGGGSYAIFDLNAVLEALQKAGYLIDPNKKSMEL